MADVMFARLRPDRVTVASALLQHVAAVDPRRVPRIVPVFCGLRLDAFDLDPRFHDHMAGQVCPKCLRNAPTELTMQLARVTGALPPDVLGATEEPEAGTYIYAAGVAPLSVRHILPDKPLTGRRLGHPIVIVECGHMGWCPISGPFPSLDWPVCAGCLKAVRARTGT